MENKAQSDGAIYTNDYKKGDKQPDWTGSIELQKDLLKQLVEKAKAGEKTEVRVALWDRVAKQSGKEYKYARMDVAQPKQQPEPEPVEPQKESVDENFEDEIPF